MSYLNIGIFQILVVILSSYFIFHGVIKYFSGKTGQTFIKLFATLFIWFSILIFSLFPSLPQNISMILGLGSNLNTLIFLGFVMVFLILFKLISIIERIERTITELVRRESLKDLKDTEKEN